MKTKRRSSPAVRRVGYVVVIALSIFMWWAVGRLLGWGWPPFLTEDFSRVVPWYRVALAIDIAFNVAFLFYDPRWFAAIGDSMRAVANAVVAYLVLRVFPFDFSAYDFDWERFTRVVLILAIIATWFTAIAGVVRAAYHLSRPSEDAPPSDDVPESS